MPDSRPGLEIRDRLDTVSHEEWQMLFPGQPGARPAHLQEAGMDRFSFQGLVVRDGEPILMLPMFETRYEVHSSYHGFARPWLEKLEEGVSGIVDLQ